MRAQWGDRRPRVSSGRILEAPLGAPVLSPALRFPAGLPCAQIEWLVTRRNLTACGQAIVRGGPGSPGGHVGLGQLGRAEGGLRVHPQRAGREGMGHLRSLGPSAPCCTPASRNPSLPAGGEFSEQVWGDPQVLGKLALAGPRLRPVRLSRGGISGPSYSALPLTVAPHPPTHLRHLPPLGPHSTPPSPNLPQPSLGSSP